MLRNKLVWNKYSGLIVIFIISLGVSISEGYWVGVLNIVILIFLIFFPLYLVKETQIYIPFVIRLFIGIFGFLTLILGEVFHFYSRFAFWDKFLHFQSGLLFALGGYILIYNLNEPTEGKKKISPLFIAIFLISFGLAVGAIWEIIEFGIDGYFGSHWQASNADTMWDMIFDGLGAVIVSVTGYFWMHHHKRLPLTPTEE